MKSETNWNQAIRKLIRHYRNEPQALNDGGNIYRLLVMVLLAAQSSDSAVNKATPELFKAFPTLKALSNASTDELTALLGSIRFHRKKIKWLQQIASLLGDDHNIPRTMPELVALPGIGRKSANLIMRASGAKPEGVMVDLHVLRVADRLGISHSDDGIRMEKDLMSVLSPEIWGEAGSALSALGRQVCRPTNPIHSECIVNDVCEYCRKHAGTTLQAGH